VTSSPSSSIKNIPVKGIKGNHSSSHRGQKAENTTKSVIDKVPLTDTPGAPSSSFMLDRKQISKSLPGEEDHDSDVVYEESDVQALAIPLESIPDNTSGFSFVFGFFV
jgi:hypothetical protein